MEIVYLLAWQPEPNIDRIFLVKDVWSHFGDDNSTPGYNVEKMSLFVRSAKDINAANPTSWNQNEIIAYQAAL